MRTSDLIDGATSTLRARIRAKTVRPGRGYWFDRRACWAWTGATKTKRGGVRPAVQIGRRGSRVVTVARLLLCLQDGVPLAERSGLEAGHTCHHYWCVNPRHLEWQTRLENEREKVDRQAYEKWAE